VRLCITRNRVQQDKISPPPPEEEGDLVGWKRVVSDGYVTDGPGNSRFTVTLDLRARLLQVECNGFPSDGIGNALINKMCSFTLAPRSRLFATSGPISASRFEWLVADAVHVSGLLHRIQELKEFDEPPGPPQPPGLRSLLNALVDSIADNTAAMRIWKEAVYGRKIKYSVRFETHAWEALRDRFLELTDDSQVQVSFARFFELTAGCSGAVETLISSKAPFFDYGLSAPQGPEAAARSYLSFKGDEALKLGMQIVQTYGTKEQQQRAAMSG